MKFNFSLRLEKRHQQDFRKGFLVSWEKMLSPFIFHFLQILQHLWHSSTLQRKPENHVGWNTSSELLWLIRFPRPRMKWTWPMSIWPSGRSSLLQPDREDSHQQLSGRLVVIFKKLQQFFYFYLHVGLYVLSRRNGIGGNFRQTIVLPWRRDQMQLCCEEHLHQDRQEDLRECGPEHRHRHVHWRPRHGQGDADRDNWRMSHLSRVFSPEGTDTCSHS